MSKKLLDFDPKEQYKIRDETDAVSTTMKLRPYEERDYFKTETDRFGLCGSCVNFKCAKTEFAIKVAQCDVFEIKLKIGEVITECTNYSKIGTMSLDDMRSMAIIIEPDSKAGFLTD